MDEADIGTDIIKLLPRLFSKSNNTKWYAVGTLAGMVEENPGKFEEVLKVIVPPLVEALADRNRKNRMDAASTLYIVINRSSVEQLDKLKARIIEAVGHADRDAPGYKQMKHGAAKVVGAIYDRRNKLLTVEINLDSDVVLRRPKPPRGSGGMYRSGMVTANG